MTAVTSKNAARQPFMTLMRELVRAYQAFASCDARLHRELESGLTVSQADVIFTLGNTSGMFCQDIGERTLITKGTLTGVLDRLESKGLVKRVRDSKDARRTRIVLSPDGEALFERQFPLHVRSLGRKFDQLSASERDEAIHLLRKIRDLF